MEIHRLNKKERTIKKQLIDAYADWLEERNWDWWATLTFRGHPSQTIADRKFTLWIEELKNEQGTEKFEYVRVLERGAYGDNIHFHTLVGGLKSKARNFPWLWRDRWQEKAGQAAIVKFNPQQGGIRYLLKTFLPDRDFDIVLNLQESVKTRSQK